MNVRTESMNEIDLRWYESQLTQMIKYRRNVEEVDPWLKVPIHTAAMCWQMMEKTHNDLMTGDLTLLESGSMGQVKTVVNPLLASYKELQRTMLLHYKAIGLSFDVDPERMTKNATKDGREDNDPMEAYMKSLYK